jgi:uncharacterized protein
METIFRPYTSPSKRSDRSARDRLRHREKVKDSIRDNIGDILAEESIIGRNRDKIIKVPIKSIKEYRFVYGDNSPQVAEGAGAEQVGDVVKHGKDQQKGEGGPGNTPGDNIIETDISIEDLVSIMFDDLELPNMERKALRQLSTEVLKKRKGRQKTGIRSKLDRKATVKNRLKRLWTKHGRPNAHLTDPSYKSVPTVSEPEEVVDDRFPFHKDDIRYYRTVTTTRDESNAVVFCIMDTSGSMSSTKKYLARSFYFLLYQFVRQKYENVEVVFISHHTEAKEVSEDEFFHKVESGGTYISSGYSRTLEIIEERYHPSLWNVYAFHCSDGDNFYSDNDKAVELARQLCSVCNIFGYGEIKPTGNSYYSGSMLDIFQEISDENFQTILIEKKEDLWPGFKAFLKAETESSSQIFNG